MSLEEILREAAEEIADPESGLGEPGGFLLPDGTKRSFNLALVRHDEMRSEEPGQLQPLFVAHFPEGCETTATFAEFDGGTWKLIFADVPGGTLLAHDIGHWNKSRPGMFILEIFGAGYALP
ncbi:MAG: hypothetical protein ABSA67_10275 [Candidatus Brocadiia bacterium]|jgi:hypothetical protein